MRGTGTRGGPGGAFSSSGGASGDGEETAGGRGGGRLARRTTRASGGGGVRDRWMCTPVTNRSQRLDSARRARGGARPDQINRPSSGVSWCLIVLERRSTEDFRDGSRHHARSCKSFARVSSHEIVKIEEARLRSAHAGFCFGFRVASDGPAGSSRAFGNPHRGSRNRRRSPRPG